jgi:hypothetical protein
MKIRPVGAELFHADGRADRRTDTHNDDNSRFSQFCQKKSLTIQEQSGFKEDPCKTQALLRFNRT